MDETFNILVNGEIEISEKLWSDMNAVLSKDEIKQLISDNIGDNSLDMPMCRISKDEAEEDFKQLELFQTSLASGEWFTRYDYKYELSDIYIENVRVGNRSSDYFHQLSRWHCDSINAPSPYRSWTIERFRLTLLNALWTLKVTKVNSRILRSMIGLRKYIASQFRPSSAKTIYDHFDAKHVLDFSSGWGDRLSGFSASNAISYVGVDPNERLVDGYASQIEFYDTGKSVEMVQGCAESVDYGDRMFDLVFTSPPYFNIERYTHEDNQSFKKYKKIDMWLEEFLYVSFSNAGDHLEDGGTMVIKISDVYSNHTINRICDNMNDHISTLEGAEYDGCIGYKMNKRPNSKALAGKEGVFCEPMWIWKKRIAKK